MATWRTSYCPCALIFFTKFYTVQCKHKITKIQNIYSQKRNWAASVLTPICMCLWAFFLYSHDRSAYSAAVKYVDRFWEYLNRSQTHECGNWVWGRAIPFLGIHKWDFRCTRSVTNLNPKCISQATCSLHGLLLLRPLPRPLPLSTFPIRKTPFVGVKIYLLCGICAKMEEESRRHYFAF
jgi:hypothetical protein